VLELARELAVPVREEAFLTGTGDLVVPVVRIDGRTVGTGAPGPVTCRLREAILSRTEQDV
jgi:branched-subunit amino acid aminotransferase/4-amino-4-deoxychorismate lyase